MKVLGQAETINQVIVSTFKEEDKTILLKIDFILDSTNQLDSSYLFVCLFVYLFIYLFTVFT